MFDLKAENDKLNYHGSPLNFFKIKIRCATIKPETCTRLHNRFTGFCHSLDVWVYFAQ